MRLQRINYKGGYLWVDKEALITDYFYKETTKEVFFETHPKRLEVINKQKKFRFKIVAQTNLNLENIPHVEIGEEDNIEALGVKFLINNGWEHLSVRGSIPEKPYPTSFVADLTRWCEGYKAAQAKGNYSEEDIV
jgi:hypothetical protein